MDCREVHSVTCNQRSESAHAPSKARFSTGSLARLTRASSIRVSAGCFHQLDRRNGWAAEIRSTRGKLLYAKG